MNLLDIITHLAGQTYVWQGCKWNFAGPQIYLQPAEIKIQLFGCFFFEIVGLQLKVLHIKTKCVSKFFI